jgi:hypothetical protein
MGRVGAETVFDVGGEDVRVPGAKEGGLLEEAM